MAATVSAPDVAVTLFDSGTADIWQWPELSAPADADYATVLAKAAERSGADESVMVWRGDIAGVPAMLIAGEFGFLAGSVGAAAAERIVEALRAATEEGRAVVAAPTSGGTRMQEGTPAFVRMVPIAAAVRGHRDAGLPYVVWLRHPTTGGVMATWGSLGQVTAAEPGALCGFLGPRVYELLEGRPFPSGVQTAENLARVGVIDAVVPVAGLREWVEAVLRAATGSGPMDAAGPEAAGGPGPRGGAPVSSAGGPDAWECVLATRRQDRAGVRDVLDRALDEWVELSGTQEGERDESVLLAAGRADGRGVVVVGQDRSAGRAVGPGGLRTARRGLRLAAEWGVPVVTVVDTDGGELSAAAEEGAMAGEIARCLSDFSAQPTPVVSLLLGSGCGGAALAMLPGDIVLAAEDAWVTPLPPEGAAAILHRDAARAPELARSQQIRAVDLWRAGVVDELVIGGGGDLAAAAGDALRRALGVAQRSERRVTRFESGAQ